MRPYLLSLFVLLSTSMVGQVDSTIVEDADTVELLPNIGVKLQYPYNRKGYYLYQNQLWDSLTVSLDERAEIRFGCRIHGIGPKGKIQPSADLVIIPWNHLSNRA